jgi:hypothetical protein
MRHPETNWNKFVGITRALPTVYKGCLVARRVTITDEAARTLKR